jgi:hypothetical protein
MPFRDAHAVVGGLVRESLDGRGGPSPSWWPPTRRWLGPEAAALLAPGVAVTRRTTPAAPARMHWCANVVTGGDGEAQAVLLRALEPVAGLEEMRAARPAARRDLDLCRGPARLCQALGITGSHDGSDLTVPGPDRPWLALDGQPRPAEVVAGVRVGISKAVGHPWRFAVAGSRYVSAPRLTGSPGGSSGG